MMSNLANESMLNLMFRLSNKSVELKQPDPPIITEKGVTVIDWNQSDSDAVNRYLNRLIRLQLNRYSALKDPEKRKSADRVAASRSLNRSGLGELDDEPLVSVFDSFGKFTESVELIQRSDDSNRKSNEPNRRNHIASVDRLVEPDSLLFYLTLRNYFGPQFAQIKNRLLVIVYMTDTYFEKLLAILADRQFYFHLIIVTYTYNDHKLRNVLRKHFAKFQTLGYLKINHAAANSLEIKAYDKGQCKEMTHQVDL